MANSKKISETNELGKCLVKALQSESRDVDPLSNWMAHFLAEKIQRSESTTGIAKKKADHDCFETILKLWKHRNSMPDHVRPFQDFETISRTLVRLDTEQVDYFYPLNLPWDQSEQDDVSQIMDCICETDRVAQVIIRELLCAAIEKCSDQEMLDTLQQCQEEFRNEDIVSPLSIFQKSSELNAKSDTDESIEKLNEFIALCEEVKNDLKRKRDRSKEA